MTLQVPPELMERVKSFLADGRYKTEIEVLSRALGELKRSEDDLAAIRAGFDDEAADRTEPARALVARAKEQLGGLAE
jgi:predicted transcriptional regulator